MSERKRVLFLCTGNSARSQMAEGLLRHFAGDAFEVFSAGVAPTRVRPEAVKVMREIGIDISDHRSQSVDEFSSDKFDYVITVCDKAKEHCPVFAAETKQIHWSFDDPGAANGHEAARLAVFRRVRDEIRQRLQIFSHDNKQSPLACDMTAIPLDQRDSHLTQSRELFAQVQEARELSNGYQFGLRADSLTNVAQFIALERLCCPFLTFAIEIEAENGPLWLRLTGREGVKTFIREEISGLIGITQFAEFTRKPS